MTLEGGVCFLGGVGSFDGRSSFSEAMADGISKPSSCASGILPIIPNLPVPALAHSQMPRREDVCCNGWTGPPSPSPSDPLAAWLSLAGRYVSSELRWCSSRAGCGSCDFVPFIWVDPRRLFSGGDTLRSLSMSFSLSRRTSGLSN